MLCLCLQRSEEGGSTDTASTSKSKHDSGVGRTDDSVKADESSEHVSQPELTGILGVVENLSGNDQGG